MSYYLINWDFSSFLHYELQYNVHNTKSCFITFLNRFYILTKRCCTNKAIQHIITQLDVIFFLLHTCFIHEILLYWYFLGFVNSYVPIFLLVFPFTWIRIDTPRSSNSFYFICTIQNIKEVIVFVFFLQSELLSINL